MDNKLITSIMVIFAIIILIATALVPAIDSFDSTSETSTVAILKNIDGTAAFDGDISTSVCSTNSTWVITTDGKLFGYGGN